MSILTLIANDVTHNLDRNQMVLTDRNLVWRHISKTEFEIVDGDDGDEVGEAGY